MHFYDGFFGARLNKLLQINSGVNNYLSRVMISTAEVSIVSLPTDNLFFGMSLSLQSGTYTHESHYLPLWNHFSECCLHTSWAKLKIIIGLYWGLDQLSIRGRVSVQLMREHATCVLLANIDWILGQHTVNPSQRYIRSGLTRLIEWQWENYEKKSWREPSKTANGTKTMQSSMASCAP